MPNMLWTKIGFPKAIWKPAKSSSSSFLHRLWSSNEENVCPKWTNSLSHLSYTSLHVVLPLITPRARYATKWQNVDELIPRLLNSQVIDMKRIIIQIKKFAANAYRKQQQIAPAAKLNIIFPTVGTKPFSSRFNFLYVSITQFCIFLPNF